MSQAMSVSELFPVVLNDFTSTVEHFKRYSSVILKVLIPYILVSLGWGLLTILVSSLTNSMEASTAVVVGAILSLLMLGVSIILFVFCIYYGFCQFRLVVNSHQQTPETLASTNLWAFENSFWGYLGLAFILVLLSFPVLIAAGIGLIFLLLPGMAIAGLGWAYYSSAIFNYFENPSAGVVTALSGGLETIKENWMRWLILMLLMEVIIVILYILFFVPVALFAAILPTIVTQVLCQVIPCIFTFVSVYLMFVQYSCYKNTLASAPQA